MKELDAMVNQQATEFEEMEQERLYAVERRQASVPEAVRQETLQQCKKKFERIEKDWVWWRVLVVVAVLCQQ